MGKNAIVGEQRKIILSDIVKEDTDNKNETIIYE